MNKHINSGKYHFPERKKSVFRQRVLRLIAAAGFTAILFVISEACLISSYNDIHSKIISDEAGSALNEEEPTLSEERSTLSEKGSKPASADVSSSDTLRGIKSIVPDKDILLTVIDALPTDSGALFSVPEAFRPDQEEELMEIVDSFQEEEHSISFILLEIDSGKVLCLNPDVSYYSASTIKGPYVAALNQFSPEIITEDTEELMENTIMWSSNEDFETLHDLYGNDVMYEITQYTDVTDSIIDEYNWYPYLTPKELTKLWIGIYWYFFEDTNENSEWCRSLYTDSTESFIKSALSDDYIVYTKPGWYEDWEDVSRNDAGILLTDDHAYILTVMSDAFDSYDELEELAAVLAEAAK